MFLEHPECWCFLFLAETHASNNMATIQEARGKAPQQDCGDMACSFWKRPCSGQARHGDDLWLDVVA